jgi:endonuclease YncB( thermonuclease family)
MAQKLAAVFSLLLCSPVCFADVEGCSDGDTCFLRDSVYTGDLKLKCIQAPELNQPYGIAARDALRAEVHSTIMVVVANVGSDGKPRVELIRDDGLNLGLELVRRGLAKVSKSCNDFAYGPAEADAVKAALGLWSIPPHRAE